VEEQPDKSPLPHVAGLFHFFRDDPRVNQRPDPRRINAEKIKNSSPLNGWRYTTGLRREDERAQRAMNGECERPSVSAGAAVAAFAAAGRGIAICAARAKQWVDAAIVRGRISRSAAG